VPESEIYTDGDPNTDVEFYYTWEVGYDPVRTYFYSRTIWDNYYYEMDASLMVASKGGLNYQALSKMGYQTKYKFYQRFVEINKKMNSSSSGNNGSGDAEGDSA
jgi:hypothetical protein